MADVELENALDTNGSRKRQHANKRALVTEVSGVHGMDPFDEKGKEIIDHVSRQNVDVEGKNSANIGEVVNSELAHTVECIPTEKNEGKTDGETGHTRPVEKLICNDTESGVKVNDNKEEDPSLTNEDFGGDKRAGLTSFEDMDSEDHNKGSEERQLVAVVERYSSSRNHILWMHSQLEVKRYWLNGQFMTTRLLVLMIVIEYLGSLFEYLVQKIVMGVSTYSTSSRGTILEFNPDVPCELMPNFQQRELKHHYCQKAVTQNSGMLDDSALSNSQRRQVAQKGWKYMTSVIEQAFNVKIDSMKWCHCIFQYHRFQIPKCTVYAIPLPPRHFNNVSIPVRESSNQPLSDTVYPAASQVSDLPNFATADHVSDEEVHIDDHVTSGSGTDAYAASVVGMTDPQILDQSTFEISFSRLGACSPHSEMMQETDQHATCRYDFRMSQNESTRALYIREIHNLPAPALPAVISSRSSEGPSQTTGSNFAPVPSAELCRQGDSFQTTDLCPNRSADHHSSNCLQKCNDTKKEIAPSETGSASVDDWRSLWDSPRTPGIFNIKERDQKEVAALKESKTVEPTKNQQKVSANTGTNKKPHNNPDYTEKTTRIASFRNWSPECQQPEEMADCGFYHTGYQNIVKCFSCDGHFKNWVPNRNLWIEHARLFPKCAYVLQMKGVEFVNNVRMMTEESNDKEDHTVQHGVPLAGAESSNTIENSGTEEGVSAGNSQIDPERCKSCEIEPICAVFVPCLHRYFCSECATSFRKCPICGKPIENILSTSLG